jgi:UPF0755 protein
VIARLLVVLFALVVVGVGAFVGYVVLGDTNSFLGTSLGQLTDPMAPMDPNDSTKVVVTVAPGSTASDIGSELQQQGLVRSALFFRFAADQAGVGSSLAAGDYELSKSMSTPEIVEVLAKGEVKRGLVATIPEGWRSEQIADRLDSTGVAARNDFLQAISAPRLLPDFAVLPPPQPQRLEGFLFPETYEVRQKVSGADAADLMLKMFNQRIGDALRTPSETGLNAVQVITLASIVEREAKVPSERSTIASVYLNRLAQNMPLQADPTVQYAVATRDGAAAAAYGYWRPLTSGDLNVESPYNTYVHTGLPPGPICNPGEPSIRAVLQPAHTDFAYFVATNDGRGTHLFARTLDEHNANVARVNATASATPTP